MSNYLVIDGNDRWLAETVFDEDLYDFVIPVAEVPGLKKRAAELEGILQAILDSERVTSETVEELTKCGCDYCLAVLRARKALV